ncbi:MAG: disulfide bond formation protein B [Haloferacaceae archaeon]
MDADTDRARLALAAGTLVAAVATAGSLWFSLGIGLVPCELCWYQRILMYPLVLVLGVATLDRRTDVWRTALPFVALGAPLSAYHSYIQVAGGGGVCTVGGCTAIQYPMLGGLLTIPRLALLGFLLVAVALVVVVRAS